MSNWKPFNINNYIRVKLTKEGLEHLQKTHDEDNARFGGLFGEWTPPKVDEEGWSKFQLWALFHDFGDALSMGKPVPFETVIELDIEC